MDLTTPIYADDIKESLRTDGFFGAGFEDKLEQAEAEGTQVIVGYFLNKPEIDA
jgi:hypothetical protein